MSETVHSGSGGGPTEAAGAPTAPTTPDTTGPPTVTAKRVVIVLIGVVVVVWIAIKAADNFTQFVTVTLNGL